MDAANGVRVDEGDNISPLSPYISEGDKLVTTFVNIEVNLDSILSEKVNELLCSHELKVCELN